MTDNNTDRILPGFREWWLREGYTSRSADSYCSGIRRANKEFFEPTCRKDMFDELTTAIARGTAVDWLTALIGTIGAKAADTTDPAARKGLQDILCHLRKFIGYIAEAQDNAALPETAEYVRLPEPAPGVPDFNSYFMADSVVRNHAYFDHDTLVNDFSRRIRSLACESGSGNVFVPMRILDMLFAEATRSHRNLFRSMGIRTAVGRQFDFKRWYAAWVRRIVENVIFHTTKGDYRLSELEGLKIERSTRRVWVVDKKDRRTIPVLSEGPSGIAPMEADELRSIRLVPSERMEKMLDSLESALVIMRMLTDDIRKAVNAHTASDSGRPGTPGALYGWYCSQVDWNFIAPLLPHLCTELNYIAAATRLTAMSAAHNLKKH